MVKEIKGFIFINRTGDYAVADVTTGFSPQKDIIRWTKNINEADIFPHENIARRKYSELAKCHAIMAVSERTVTLLDWSNPGHDKPVPNAPVAPVPAPNQHDTAYPCAECMDAARAALGKGKYNTESNYVRDNAGYIVLCAKKFGQAQWDEACRLVGLEK